MIIKKFFVNTPYNIGIWLDTPQNHSDIKITILPQQLIYSTIYNDDLSRNIASSFTR